MTNLPDDPIDAAEAQLARRVRDYTEPAVVPVDHAAVASAAARAGGPRRSGSRFGLLGAGAAAVAGLAAVAILVNTWRGPNVGASPSVPFADTGLCTIDKVEATVGGWEGAAGHRIGHLTVTNTSSGTCTLTGDLQPSLIDRNGTSLIVGKPVSGNAIQLAAGASVQALVQTGNYCGPTAQEPAAVALELGRGGRLIAKPIAGDVSSGVPPCMGENGPTDDITMQAWAAAQG